MLFEEEKIKIMIFIKSKFFLPFDIELDSEKYVALQEVLVSFSVALINLLCMFIQQILPFEIACLCEL